MRTRLLSTCLILEAFVVFFAALIALKFVPLPSGVVWTAMAVLIGACVIAVGLQRTTLAVPSGALVQVLLLVCGFWVPSMVLMGAVFAALWVWLWRVGEKIDRERAMVRDALESEPAPPPHTAGEHSPTRP